MKFSVYQRTEQAGRKNNEDRMGYTYTRESALFVVADGMGGHAHGELAAQMALEVVTAAFQTHAHPLLADPRLFLTQTLLAAHHHILQFSHEQGMADSPRTTLVALVVQEGQAWWAHCGDSRLYWFRAQHLQTRTLDHSYTEQKPKGMLPKGMTSADYLAKLANRNVLFTCLGAPTKPIYDVSAPVKLLHGDRFLLCSDGLWGQFSDAELTDFYLTDTVPNSSSFLIDLALKRGGRYCDNVTVIGLEWEDSAQGDASQANVVTDSLTNAVFASTVQSHLLDEPYDLDIESSLREINNAIQKSNLAHPPK
jgi:serine/threonine protein phosphatase PrpC